MSVKYTWPVFQSRQFDSSRDRGQPFTVHLGRREVIAGWEQGIPGMKVGETRKLTIPAEMGYGSTGQPPDIPPNATLVFEVELLDVKA